MTLLLTAKAEDEDDDNDESESVRTAGCVTLEPPLSAKIISPLSQLCVTVLRHLVTRAWMRWLSPSLYRPSHDTS